MEEPSKQISSNTPPKMSPSRVDSQPCAHWWENRKLIFGDAGSIHALKTGEQTVELHPQRKLKNPNRTLDKYSKVSYKEPQNFPQEIVLEASKSIQSTLQKALSSLPSEAQWQYRDKNPRIVKRREREFPVGEGIKQMCRRWKETRKLPVVIDKKEWVDKKAQKFSAGEGWSHVAVG